MLHKNVLIGDNHFIQHWDVADSNARTALSSVFSSNDVGKVARQQDNSNFYILQNTAGAGVWSPINGGGAGGGVGTQFSGTNISGTLNTDGLSLSVAAPSGLLFSNSNGVSFGTNAGTVTASHNGLTTAALSNHSHGNPTLALTNLSGTTASNSNGVTFSLSAAAGGGGADGYNIIGVNGVSVGSNNTIQFSNGNNVSFGLAGSTVTASASFNQTVQTQNSLAVLGSSGNISFGNGNGVTFGGNASTITASVITDYVRTSNSSLLQHTSATSNITALAFPSAQTTKFAGTGFSGTNISGTVNSNGIQLSVAPGGGGADGFNILAAGTQTATTAGTVLFSNSNGISFGMNNSSVITASYTVPTQSADTNKAGTGFTSAGVNIGLSATLNTNGLSLSATVPAQSVQTQNVHNVTIAGNTAGVGAAISSGTLTFVGGNNITISQNGNALTISGANVGGAQTGVSAISAGTTQMTEGTAVFSNSNGMSFGVNGNTITASHNGLTTAAQSNHQHGVSLNLTNISGTTNFNSNGISLSLSAAAQSVQPVAISGSNGSFVFSTVSFGNSNGISFYTTNGSVVASHTVPTQSVQTQNSVQVLGSSGNISFGNANGITFGGNASTITASHNGLTTAALSNHSHGNPTLALTNVSGTTASNSGGLTISLSVAPPAGGGGGAAISAGANSQNTGTVAFSNSNNISFGLNGAGVMTASAGGGGLAVPGSTVSDGTFVFSNSNGVSFGLNGSTLTASVAGGGGAQTLAFWENIPLAWSANAGQTLGAIGGTSGSVRMVPIYLTSPVSVNYVQWYVTNSIVTSTIAGSQSATHAVGIYNSASSLISSQSFGISASMSSVSGTIHFPILGNPAVTSSSSWSTTAQAHSLFGSLGILRYIIPFNNSLNSGNYWLAFHQRASTVGAAVGLLPAILGKPRGNLVSFRDLGDNVTAYSTKPNAAGLINIGQGWINVTQTALPNTFSSSQLVGSATFIPFIQLR